jgi:hypothetical protein
MRREKGRCDGKGPAECGEESRSKARGSVKKNEDFHHFSVDLSPIAGFMLNQRKNSPSSSP